MTDKRTPQPYDILTDYDRLINNVGQVLEVLGQFEELQTVAVPAYALQAILDEHKAITQKYYSAIFAKTSE